MPCRFLDQLCYIAQDLRDVFTKTLKGSIAPSPKPRAPEKAKGESERDDSEKTPRELKDREPGQQVPDGFRECECQKRGESRAEAQQEHRGARPVQTAESGVQADRQQPDRRERPMQPAGEQRDPVW